MSGVWWEPGRQGGLLSRRWAQAYVVPLPALKAEELENSLRFKVQALLPSSDLLMTTRFFRHRGQLYGLALVDRLPEPKPEAAQLRLGMPLMLPSAWPSACLLAVASPEGWEVHLYENYLLSVSYPPVKAAGTLVKKVLDLHPDKPVYWMAPDPDYTGETPSWAKPAPQTPRKSWGIPWAAPRRSRWPWILGTVFWAAGLAACIGAGAALLQTKQERNRHWEVWLQSARNLGVPALSAQKLQAVKALAGESLEEVAAALARVWGGTVEIRRLELSEGKLTLTARAASALSAAAAAAKDPAGARWRVVQIRPVVGGEEFDLEGQVVP